MSSLKRRLARIEKQHPPEASGPQLDLSKLSGSEIAFLESIREKMPIVGGNPDLMCLTDEELYALEAIVVKLKEEAGA